MPLPSAERIPGGRAFASNSRRVRTLFIAGVVFVVLFVLTLTLPVPYVILSPGPTFNTLGSYNGGTPIIKIDGRTPRATTGHLNLTTVSVTTRSVTAFQAIKGWLASDETVVPRSAIYPPGESEQQTNKQNAQDFVTAQDSATVAALCELGYPHGFGVVDVTKGGPSDGVLKSGDALDTVDGKPANSGKALLSTLQTLDPGSTVPVEVTRQGKKITRKVTLGKPPSGKGARLGVTVSTTCLAPFTVDLGLANQIGGPSAGLMFALGIMDKVGTSNLTGGRFIAGTGTIDTSGNVGPIGGIQLKMIAARRKGATVFLAPAGNCSDVRGDTPAGLDVVKVSTLHGAVTDLHDLQHGTSVPHC